MSATAATATPLEMLERPASPTILVRTTERFECIRCESVIPAQNVLRSKPNASGVQTVVCRCPGCAAVFRFGRRSRSGGFVGDVQVVTSRAELAIIGRALDAVAGHVQVA